MHPALLRPHLFTEEPIASDIGMLESAAGFHAVRKSLLSAASGSQELSVGGDRNVTVSFTWEGVMGRAYIVCVVTHLESGDIYTLRRVAPSTNPELVYHRLDVVSSPGKVEVISGSIIEESQAILDVLLNNSILTICSTIKECHLIIDNLYKVIYNWWIGSGMPLLSATFSSGSWITLPVTSVLPVFVQV